jgi:hypothetical protein
VVQGFVYQDVALLGLDVLVFDLRIFVIAQLALGTIIHIALIFQALSENLSDAFSVLLFVSFGWRALQSMLLIQVALLS